MNQDRKWWDDRMGRWDKVVNVVTPILILGLLALVIWKW